MIATAPEGRQRRAFALLLAGAAVFAAFIVAAIWSGMPGPARVLFWRGEFGKIPEAIRKNAVLPATVDFDDTAYPAFHGIAPLPGETDGTAWRRQLKAWEGFTDVRIRVGAETPVFVFYGQIRAALRKPGDRVTLEIRPSDPGGATTSVELTRPAGCKERFEDFDYENHPDGLLLARSGCCPAGGAIHEPFFTFHAPPSLPVRVDEDGLLFGKVYDGDEPLAEILDDEPARIIADKRSGFFVFEVPEMMPASAFAEFLKLVGSRPEIRHYGIVLDPEFPLRPRHVRDDFLPKFPVPGRGSPPVR